MQIVLYSDDINLLSYWESVCNKQAISIDDMKDLLLIRNALIIINNSAFDEKQKETILKLKKNGNSILVLHRVPNIDSGRQLLAFGANGYGNALMKEHFLHSAIEAIEEGLIWLHPEFTSALIEQIPPKKVNDIALKIVTLSEREKEVVFLLKDGATYKRVAELLDITPRTVKAHASSIYKKLQVKDRLSLALLLK